MVNLSLYRPCVGIMLINKSGKVFVGQRINDEKGFWQMPQGGIGNSENFEIAALRELFEETSIDKVKVISAIWDWILYDLPKSVIGPLWGGRYIGQKQKWVLMAFLGSEESVNLNVKNPEFKSWRWADINRLVDDVVFFKRELYIKVVEQFRPVVEKVTLNWSFSD